MKLLDTNILIFSVNRAAAQHTTVQTCLETTLEGGETGATLVSCDTDFARFRHLRWENPLRA